ncbi:A24 family peptidase [Hyalangium rubrum]|uniref:A24 family peptidase n=1 Tax=Hyalangium rubrum TaxID=3103134 RepID=A0ABU5HBL3_9BACT|nr:A24 family peptidase [Hyalangium sp. s54d21]MDY7230870.1 A24 family peptidase [Hyalangium sp. s54d21]
MTPVQIALWTVLGVALVISVVTDVLRHRILDVVTYPLMVVGLGTRLAVEGVGGIETGLISGLVSGLGLAALLLPGALRGKMGWGDVKLMGGVGAVLGFPAVMAAGAFISLAGAFQAVVTLIWKGEVWDTLAAAGRRWAIKARLLREDSTPAAQRHIPYGVAIALGTFWAMWWQQTNSG